jgi:transposase-like protein
MEFQECFASEEACREYLFASRWPDGFRCRRCGSEEVGVMHTRRLVWQCKGCGTQTSVTAGTVMHGARQPLRLWFWAAYLMATHHPGISAVQLQRQLGISRHETAWMMLHKLRRAMVAPVPFPSSSHQSRGGDLHERFIAGPGDRAALAVRGGLWPRMSRKAARRPISLSGCTGVSDLRSKRLMVRCR